MCLHFDKKQTTALRARIKRLGGKVTCYKVLRRHVRDYATPAMRELRGKYTDILWPGPGITKSDRKKKGLTLQEQKSGAVYKGIHVYSSRKCAVACAYGIHHVVPVTCSLDDFVAANRKEAVFMQVHLSKVAYARALRE